MSKSIIAEAQRRMRRNKKARMRVFCHEILALAGEEFEAPVAAAPVEEPEAPVEAPAETEGGEEIPPYEDWNAADLKAECENRGLPKGGNKSDLIARLEEHDASEPDDGE
jgi:hypothetical protein